MTPKEYNKIKDPDTALAVRLAVTLGWPVEGIEIELGMVWVRQPWFWDVGQCIPFLPFTDTSIPYGLIGRGVTGCVESALGDYYAWTANRKALFSVNHESKTHAIINAYCQADPMWHWAKFSSTKE